MKRLVIKHLTDFHECETCGSSYAEGAIVSLDGEIIVDMEPFAHCFGGSSFDDFEIYHAVLAKLGYSLEEELE